LAHANRGHTRDSRASKNEIQERRTIVVNDNAVVVMVFYEFTRMTDGKPVPAPARFTVLPTKTDGQWLIAHQYSSPERRQRGERSRT